MNYITEYYIAVKIKLELYALIWVNNVECKKNMKQMYSLIHHMQF